MNEKPTPRVMGVLNLTPDSFSDGAQFSSFSAALDCARQMVSDGADILDIGGESTRPGAVAVSLDEELERVIPLIEAIRAESGVLISIDTSKAQVMRAAVAAGATMINDVRALQDKGALGVAAQLNVDVCLMHMSGVPSSMQAMPVYHDVIEEVYAFLERRVEACLSAGILRDKLVVDPGFGFGKTLEHNLLLLKKLERFKSMELPLLVGLSRKSMLGTLTGRPVDERLGASVAAATLAVVHGANVVRVHDVAATVDALKVCHAVMT